MNKEKFKFHFCGLTFILLMLSAGFFIATVFNKFSTMEFYQSTSAEYQNQNTWLIISCKEQMFKFMIYFVIDSFCSVYFLYKWIKLKNKFYRNKKIKKIIFIYSVIAFSMTIIFLCITFPKIPVGKY